MKKELRIPILRLLQFKTKEEQNIWITKQLKEAGFDTTKKYQTFKKDNYGYLFVQNI